MKTMKISVKVSDRCAIQCDKGWYDGYVPSGIGIGFGDYLALEIDVETGCIIGWNKDAAKKFMEKPYD